MVELDTGNVCMSPPPPLNGRESLQCRASPNPIEINSAAKLNEFGNHMDSLQQKIDMITAKTTVAPHHLSIRTPPPIEETGDVEKDFETVFEFNSNEKVGELIKAEIQLRATSPTPPPLPKTAPPGVPLVQVAPPPTPPKPTLQKQTSVNTLKPWQKQHEFRPMSAIWKDKQDDPLKNINFNFKPIGTVASSEDIRKESAEIAIPQPIYTSKSVQDLIDVTNVRHEPEKTVHGSLDNLFMSKSSDDLIMPDIDGIQGIRSNKYKKIRHGIRPSVSQEEILESKEPQEDVYENLDKIRDEVKQLKQEAADLDRKKAEMEIVIRPVVKKPMPLPRVGSENELNRSSKTISFVFDPKVNEFVLESEREDFLLPNVDVIERNSALLQKRSSSTSNIVPIHVSSPMKSGTGFVKSMDSLDVVKKDSSQDNSLNEKGNFFNFRFFKKEKDNKPAAPSSKSVFYSEPVELITMEDDRKYEAKLVHIGDDGSEVQQVVEAAKGDRHHYEVVTVNQTFNRSLSTFGQQNIAFESSRKFSKN